MDCDEVGEFLEQYHEGDASLKENREIVSHVNKCELCRQAFQEILYDMDLAAYTTFFQELDPPKGFTDKIFDALPGSGRRPAGKKGAGRGRPPSSPRLSPLGGERKTKGRKGRQSSSGRLRPVRPGRKTALRRRRDAGKEKSGVFLQDQIFGTHEKKTGLIITYCEDCGERIDPADFETGAAIHHQNTSYCVKCKVKVEGFKEAAPEKPVRRKTAAKAKAPSHAPHVARPPSGRVAPVRAKKGANLPLIGGVLMGAAVLIIVAVVVVGSMGGDGGNEYTVSKESAVGSGAGEKAGTDPGKNADSTPAPEEVDAVGEEVKAREDFKKKREEDKKEKERLKRVPYDKIDAVRKKLRAMEEEGKFEKANNYWGGFLQKAEENEKIEKKNQITDEKTGKMVVFTEEHLKIIRDEQAGIVQRWRRWVGSEVDKIRREALHLCDEHKFEEALEVLKKYPSKWDDQFQTFVESLHRTAEDIKMVKFQYEQAKKREAQEKCRRKIELGKWVDLVIGKDDFVANWHPQGKTEVEKDDDGRWVVRMDSDGSSIFSKFSNAPKWFDYELEVEIRSSAMCLVIVREDPRSHKKVLFGLRPVSQWKKFKFNVEGVTLELYVDDELIQTTPAEIRPGGIWLVVRGSGSVKLRNMKVKINKVR